MRLYILIASLFMFFNLFSKNRVLTICYLDSSQAIVSIENVLVNDNKPNPVFELFRKKQKLNRKITAAILAFPFPFGIVGLHRIYLGTKPHVPVAYIASLGGGFGLLPLIDFFVIALDKDFEHYKNNSKVFMWMKD